MIFEVYDESDDLVEYGLEIVRRVQEGAEFCRNAGAVYGRGFLTIRAAKLSTSVACPWPFPESKVYDPQGFYEKAGHSGPFFEGKWSTWLSGQPDGRPFIQGPVPPRRCGPGHS
ncbi:hypothetical protein GCM10009641_02820 [Mycobacterium cookii]|uniref:Uncharacterized protein n=1 Tax=Mycobacterium cookii TaxID=1775 RepID=A0A7I7L502_9MYCO|nr:hypothetical protein MCOO_46870 [Mycobacterium cookii]